MEIWKKMLVGVFFWTQCTSLNIIQSAPVFLGCFSWQFFGIAKDLPAGKYNEDWKVSYLNIS